jgi:hypothetical protein
LQQFLKASVTRVVHGPSLLTEQTPLIAPRRALV